MRHVWLSVCSDADTILALRCMLRAAPQLLLVLPTLSGMQQQSPCSQEDPEWTAEKELCQRKGIPYQVPQKGSKVMLLIASATTKCCAGSYSCAYAY